MLKRQEGFRLFLGDGPDDGHVDIGSNLVENAIRSPAMNRRNALFASRCPAVLQKAARGYCLGPLNSCSCCQGSRGNAYGDG